MADLTTQLSLGTSVALLCASPCRPFSYQEDYPPVSAPQLRRFQNHLSGAFLADLCSGGADGIVCTDDGWGCRPAAVGRRSAAGDTGACARIDLLLITGRRVRAHGHEAASGLTSSEGWRPVIKCKCGGAVKVRAQLPLLKEGSPARLWSWSLLDRPSVRQRVSTHVKLTRTHTVS